MIKNRLLKRQLKKVKIHSFDDLTEERFQNLLHLVARSYSDYEEDKNLYENVSELASQEFQGLNARLERKVEILEKTNNNIRDSIEYASLMQQAIVPDSNILKSFFKDFFVCWKPRDIVGGDIYFIDKMNQDEVLVMVIDGAGHGVSGAFLTMLVKAIEGQIVAKIKEKVLEPRPALILEYFNHTIKAMLQQEKGSRANSGFDGGVLYYNKKTNRCQYAGAKTPLYLVKHHQLEVIKGDRKSVGFIRTPLNQQYTDFDIEVESGMKLYIATDGIIDQEGYDNTQYGVERFKQFILDHHYYSSNEQYEYLKNSFIEFKDLCTQSDDITVVSLAFE